MRPKDSERRWARLWATRPDRDLDAELADHLALRVAELTAQGYDPARALDLAHRALGDLARVREGCRRIDARTSRTIRLRADIDSVVGELRLALRLLRHKAGFTAAATLSLGLAIAANSTVFSIANAMVLRPPDAARPDALVRLYSGDHSPLGYSEFRIVQRSQSRCIATGVVFGLTPAWQSASASLTQSLRDGDARSGDRRSRLRWYRGPARAHGR